MNKQIHDYPEDLFRLGLKAIIINDKKEILLLKVEANNRPDYSIHEEYWDFPGGQIDYGETIEQGLKREIFEEIGITKIKIHELISSTITKIRKKAYSRDVGLIIFAYRCTIAQNQIFTISEEHTTYEWKNPSQLRKLIKNKYDDTFIKQIKKFIITQTNDK